MISEDEFVNAVGEHIAHVTVDKNVPNILAQGLLPTSELTALAGVSPPPLALRSSLQEIAGGNIVATLNHQKPILHGLNAANQMVEGHDAESWGQQLDQRVFFHPASKYGSFGASLERETATKTLMFDARKIYQALSERIFISPINTGNFQQGGAHAKRGDWIFFPITGGMQEFKAMRQQRGLIKGKDTVKEISILGGIPAKVIKDCLVEPENVFDDTSLASKPGGAGEPLAQNDSAPAHIGSFYRRIITTIAHAMIRKAENRVGVTFDYVHHIADTNIGLLTRYNRLFGFLDPRKHLPADAYHTARLRGALAADCGTCVEAEVNLAQQAGIGATQIKSILSGQVEGPLADVVALTDAVVRDRVDAPDARDAVRGHYGKAGLIELSFAMNGAALLPGIKRTMGYATACDLSLMRKLQ